MNTNEFLESMQSVGIRYVDEYTRAMQRYADLFNSVSKSGANNPGFDNIGAASDMQKRHADFLISQTPKVLAQLSEASINYYSTLADLSLRTMNDYFACVLHSAAPSKNQAFHTSAGEQTTLLFHGIKGESATNAFLISNNRDKAIDVEFGIDEVVSQDDGKRISPKAKFTPQKCRLAANSERVIQCTLPLSDAFDADQSYHGSISVVGFPEMAMRISVQVEEDAGTQAGSSDSGKTKKKAKKKKTAARKKSSKASKKT